MKDLENKIKALGKAVFALDNRWKYIACDGNGEIWTYQYKPIISCNKSWDPAEDGCFNLIAIGKQRVDTWQELCFSREECENVANVEDVRENRATVKENLTVQFTADELDLIRNVFEVKIATYGETPKVKNIFDKCNAILKGGTV